MTVHPIRLWVGYLAAAWVVLFFLAQPIAFSIAEFLVTGIATGLERLAAYDYPDPQLPPTSEAG